MTLFILPSPTMSAATPLPARLPRDLAPGAEATLRWAAHVVAGRIGAPAPARGSSAAGRGGEFGLASLARILGHGDPGARRAGSGAGR